MARTVRTAYQAKYTGQALSEKAVALSDFTGGLDLFRDGGQLTPEFTADLMNVDLLPGGGFARRNAVRAWTSGSDPAAPVRAISRLEKADGTTKLLFSVGDGVYSTDPSSPKFDTQLISVSNASSTVTWRATQANYKAYLQNGTSAPKSWNGTTLTTLAQGFNNASPKYGTYSQGKMPIAKHMTVWHGRMWCANTVESSTSYKSRVRFSFPMLNGIGETDWHGDDFFEVDPGVDGDEITALVPAGDRLYIFKAHSIHQVQGWDESNFEVFPVSRSIGAESEEAIATTGSTVYFWDDARGLLSLTPDGLTPVFRPLEKLLPSKELQGEPSARVAIIERRVWVTFTEPSSLTVWGSGGAGKRRTYVFDPALMNGAGAWTRYNLRFSCMYSFHYPAENRVIYLGANDDPKAPYHLWELEVDADYDFTGNANLSIPSWFRTAWLSDGSPYDDKTFWCLGMIIDAGLAQSFSVAMFRDWDEASRETEVVISESETSVGNPFIINKSLIAPAQYELKRPLGYASPGAHLDYNPSDPQYPGTGTTPGYDTIPYDTANIYDSTTLNYEGGKFVDDSSGGMTGDTIYTDKYVPLAYTADTCAEAQEGYDQIAPVRDTTLLVNRRFTMRKSRAVQLVFQGAMPSKRWAVRAIMLKYRQIG